MYLLRLNDDAKCDVSFPSYHLKIDDTTHIIDGSIGIEGNLLVFDTIGGEMVFGIHYIRDLKELSIKDLKELLKCK